MWNISDFEDLEHICIWCVCVISVIILQAYILIYAKMHKCTLYCQIGGSITYRGLMHLSANRHVSLAGESSIAWGPHFVFVEVLAGCAAMSLHD